MGTTLTAKKSSAGGPVTKSGANHPTVLHIVTDSFSAATAVAPLALHLAGGGWRNVVACSGKRYEDAHSFMPHLRATGLDIRDVRIPRSIRPVADLQRLVELWLLIRREQPCLVHTHFAKGGVLGRMAAWLAGTPCIHTVYDYAHVEHVGIKRWVYRLVERRTAGLARRILFISEAEHQLAIREQLGERDRFRTVGWGVNIQEFNPVNASTEQVSLLKQSFRVPAERVVIGTVARLVARKRIELLLRAAAMLPTNSVDWHVLVVGGGPLYGRLCELADDLGLSRRVSFTGFVDEQRIMPGLLAAMDVFCLPSCREGYGMAYAEAAAMGRPVVAPNVWPMKALVVEGVTGLLSRPEDPASIASALHTLLSDRELRRTMGSAGRRFATANCDLRCALQRVAAVYDEIVHPCRGEGVGQVEDG